MKIRQKFLAQCGQMPINFFLEQNFLKAWNGCEYDLFSRLHLFMKTVTIKEQVR